MTIIVGMETENGVLMGGDSAGVAGYDLAVRNDEKVFLTGPFVMGFTTSFRMGQLLRYSLKVPKQKPSESDVEFMCTTFVNAVRKCLAKGGWLVKRYEQEDGGNFLVGYKGILYEIHDDFQVAIPSESFSACGCGEGYALGALHATKEYDISDEDRMHLALEAAAACSAGVRPPFTIITHP